MGKQRVVLEHHSKPAGDRLDPGDIILFDQHSSCVGHLEPGQEAQRGRLAAPARSQQRENFPAFERQGDVVDGHRRIEALGEILESEEAHLVRFPVPRTCWSQ